MAGPNIKSEQDILDYHKYLLSNGVSNQDAGDYAEYLKNEFHKNDLSLKAARIPAIPGATGKAMTLGTLAQLKDAITGNDETKYVKELVDAAKGKGVPVKEYLKRLGAGDMGSVTLPAWMTREYRTPRYDKPQGGVEYLPSYTKEKERTVTGLDVLGGAGDIAADTLAMKGLSSGLKSAGKGLHGLAYDVPEAIHRQLQKKKGIGPKQLAWEEGIDAPSDIMPTMEKIVAERAGTYGAVTEAGGAIDINRAVMEAEQKAVAMTKHRDSTIRAKGEMALKEINRIKEEYGPRYSSPEIPEVPGLPAGVSVQKKSGFYEPVGTQSKRNIEFLDTTKEVPNPKHDPFSLTPMEPKTMSVKEKLPITTESQVQLTGKVPYTYNQYTPYGAVPAIPATPKRPFRPAATMDEASNLKSGLYDEVPNNEWNTFLSSQEGQDFSKTLARGLKNEIEKSSSEVIPGAGENIAKQNQKMEAIYNISDQATPEIMKEARRNKLLSPVDAALLSKDALVAGAKKGADILKIPRAKTYLGRKMYNLGTNIENVNPLGALFNIGSRDLFDMYRNGEN